MLGIYIQRRENGDRKALALALGVRLDTLENWFNRPPGATTFRALVAELSLSEEEASKFEETWRAARVRLIALAEEPANKLLTVRYLPDPFPPFSGRPETTVDGTVSQKFIDNVIIQAFSFANISAESDSETADPDRNEFGISKRIEAIENREVDLLVNLVTLHRLRKLNFFKTPIRISLNGVVLNGAPARVLEISRAALSGRATSDADQALFNLMTVVGEVGEAHVDRLHRKWPKRVPESSVTLNTLDQVKLAETLVKETRLGAVPLILFTDEITALGVVRALGGKGQLLLPISTDASAGSLERRHIPAHILGIGYRRPHGTADERRVDEDDAVLYDDILSTYLNHEVERTASEYQRLYDELVKFVSSSLTQSSELFISDVRRVTRAHLDELNVDVDSLIDRTSRRYARRCLQLNQRAADLYQERNPWTPVLRRARQRISQAEFRRRSAIKAALRSALNLAAGQPARTASLSQAQFRHELLNNGGAQLAYILEREFEVQLSDTETFFASHAEGSFEAFLSAFQLQFHLRSRETNVYDVRDARKSPEDLAEILGPYDRLLAQSPPTTEDGRRFAYRTSFSPTALDISIVRSFDAPVGVVWCRRSKAEVEVVDLYVTHDRRGSQVSLLLIQEAIRLADEDGLRSVSLRIGSVPYRRKDWFEAMGFREDDEFLRYTLFLLDPETRRTPTRRKRKKPKRVGRGR